MDNSRYYNDSLAYDFDMFLPKKNTESAKIVKMPQKKKSASKQRATAVVSENVKKIAIIAFVLSVICANIFLRVRITEVNDDINKIKTEIAELESENTRLNFEFENRISFKNIEESAVSLGMKKMDKSQIIYIKTNKTNAAVTSDGILSVAKD